MKSNEVRLTLTLNILRPVTDVSPGVEIKTLWTSHEDRSEADTLVVEAAVGWVGHEHGVTIDIDTLWADNIGLLPGPGLGLAQGEQAGERHEDFHCLQI